MTQTAISWVFVRENPLPRRFVSENSLELPKFLIGDFKFPRFIRKSVIQFFEDISQENSQFEVFF